MVEVGRRLSLSSSGLFAGELFGRAALLLRVLSAARRHWYYWYLHMIEHDHGWVRRELSWILPGKKLLEESIDYATAAASLGRSESLEYDAATSAIFVIAFGRL